MTQPAQFHPIEDCEWPTDIDALRHGFAGALNVYRVMAHHPELLKAWAALRQHVVVDTSLCPQHSEIVILRTGYQLGSAYEWAHHVVRGRKCGLTDARIHSLKGPTDKMRADDAILVKAVDQLFEDKAIHDDLQRELHQLVGKAGMMDLIATVGFYSTLGFILNSFRPPLDGHISDELAANPLAS